MIKTTKNIFTLNHEEAMNFFMKSKLYHKLSNQPKSYNYQLWFKNMTYTQDKKQGTYPYTLHLCQLVACKVFEPLWNNDWQKPELAICFSCDSVVDRENLNKATPVITYRDTRRYEESEY